MTDATRIAKNAWLRVRLATGRKEFMRRRREAIKLTVEARKISVDHPNPRKRK